VTQRAARLGAFSHERGWLATPGGTLSIPFDSDPKYHWWNGGQSVKETLAEVQARIAASRS